MLLSAACTAPQATQASISVTIFADDAEVTNSIPAGSTVQQALDQANIRLNELDRVEPPAYTVLTEGERVRIIRVTESFTVEEEIIPFVQQTLRNESLPKDQEVLIQPGKNGLREITYRHVYENGAEVSNQPIPIKSIVVEEPVPEIRMIGIQSPLAPVTIDGKILYIRDGNAWVIDGTTANRRALITSGDLDSRVFSLSDDGAWLLFTRISEDEGEINELWVKNIALGEQEISPEDDENPTEFSLDIANIIHFADFVPGSNTEIVYSTVEPRATAPGWQANNDLLSITFSDTGWTSEVKTILEPNFGGIYGWWGTDYVWGPDREHLTFARPDRVGMLNIKDGELTTIFELTPVQTRGDWAWIPGITWGSDGNVLYATDHASAAGAVTPEESPFFNLLAIPWGSGPALPVLTQTGMFSYPLASPPIGSLSANQNEYRVAFLQAIFPEQSESSNYRLSIMDQDGSNRKMLFPNEESAGLTPQRHWGAWSPAPMPESNHYAIVILYQGNIWIVDSESGAAYQITGDGLTTRVIWE